MSDEIIEILKPFYDKLYFSYMRQEKKLKNSSLLWTLIEIQAKKTEKYLSDSSFSGNHLSSEIKDELLNNSLIRPINIFSNNIEYVLTAKGIWEVEKSNMQYSEEDFLKFIDAKYLNFKAKEKPLDDKDKLAIFSLLCVRNFSIDSPMELKTLDHRNHWENVFKEILEFLFQKQLINQKNNDINNFLVARGSEHPIQYLMRHRNELPIKSNHIFRNDGQSTYYLDLCEQDEINLNKLKFTFKLIINEINDLDFLKEIVTFCNEIAKNKAKYVVNDYRFLNPKYDEIIHKVIKEIFVS